MVMASKDRCWRVRLSVADESADCRSVNCPRQSQVQDFRGDTVMFVVAHVRCWAYG